jgi:hypothetical protein
MTNLEKFVEDLAYRGYRNVKIEGDKLINNNGTTHIEVDISMFDFEQDHEHNRDIFSQIDAASNVWVGVAYYWYNDQRQPKSDVNMIVHTVDDIIETFTMSDIDVTLNLSLSETGTRIEKYHFERNGKTLEITRDEISASESGDRLQYVFDQLKQL